MTATAEDTAQPHTHLDPGQWVMMHWGDRTPEIGIYLDSDQGIPRVLFHRGDDDVRVISVDARLLEPVTLYFDYSTDPSGRCVGLMPDSAATSTTPTT